MAKKKQKFYVVWKGRNPGIYTTWDECKAQVDGYPKAQFKSYDSMAEAKAAYDGTYWEMLAARSDPPVPRALGNIPTPSGEYYAVDAACAGVPGDMEYRCVHMPSGEEVFARGPFPDGTNNIGEFLAIVHALDYLKREGIDAPLYSDSTVAIGWARFGRCKTKMKRTGKNDEIFRRIAQAEEWLKKNGLTSEIHRWLTDEWGENPADFGRK